VKDQDDEIRRALSEWREGTRAEAIARQPERAPGFATQGGIELPDLLTPADAPRDYLEDLGLPGEYPYTRGVQPTMYRARHWTMRMFAGFGTPRV